MFLCKLQSFQPSLRDGRGHIVTLQSVEGAERSKLTSAIQPQRGTKRLPSRLSGAEHCWLGSGVRSTHHLHDLYPYRRAKETACESASSSPFCHLGLNTSPKPFSSQLVLIMASKKKKKSNVYHLPLPFKKRFWESIKKSKINMQNTNRGFTLSENCI